MKTLFHDSHEHIDGYGDPYLGFHGVLGGAIESLDTEVLLDPFEEQLDLPPALVQLCDGRGGRHEVVGQEDQAFVCFRVVELDTSDLFRVLLSGIEAGEEAGLVADQTTGTIDIMGVHSPELGIGLGSDDEEGLREMYGVEPGVIEIASVHDNIERSGFRNELIENIDVMDLAVGDKGKCRNTSSQVEQGVEFDCRFRLAEVCPGEQGQAQVDSGGIKRIDGLLQIQAEVVRGIELSCLGYQYLGKVGIDAPVPFLIGFGQSASSDAAPNAHMITSGRNGSKTGLDITQAFTIGQLGEGHAEILVPAGECSHSLISLISRNTPSEFMHGENIHKLREDQPAGIHMQPPTILSGEYGLCCYGDSNR